MTDPRTCPVCTKKVKVRKDGRLYAHKIFGVDCHGPGVEHDAAPQRSSPKERWAVMENDQDDVLEVIPLFGKKHKHSTECWCQPHWHNETINLLIHECDN